MLIQQIIFTGKIKATADNTRVLIYYILEKSKETILEFSKGTASFVSKYNVNVNKKSINHITLILILIMIMINIIIMIIMIIIITGTYKWLNIIN